MGCILIRVCIIRCLRSRCAHFEKDACDEEEFNEESGVGGTPHLLKGFHRINVHTLYPFYVLLHQNKLLYFSLTFLNHLHGCPIHQPVNVQVIQ